MGGRRTLITLHDSSQARRPVANCLDLDCNFLNDQSIDSRHAAEVELIEKQPIETKLGKSSYISSVINPAMR